ncbi:MAG: DUF4442 domain-containing protein [Flavobacteriales bacterium]|nr:DUF4442 domain-containing protein [Flavobacteriales bacterium]
MKLNEIQLSPKLVRLILNLFPPLLFNRIKIQSIKKNFMQIKVRIRHSIINKNLHRSIFGGTIFSAIDPYFPIMYWQIFSHKNLPMEVWLKSAEISFKNPAETDLYLIFTLKEKDIHNALKGLEKDGRFQVWHEVEAVDENGIICAEGKVLVYIRNYKNLKLNAF